MFQSSSAANKAATYNNVNELTSLAGQPFSYDGNGNLLSDGQRNYFWDAESRLAGITYAAQPGKQTSFSYDGLGRRTAITTTSSGSAATTFQLWCGARLCQALSANGAAARSYYDEGEVDYASGTQLYYSPDRLGSVRDAAVVVGGASAAPQAYDYDPYGNPIQTPTGGALTDFRYAGMFYHADSGLYLTQYRAYDPRTARWLTRDPIGERGGVNLYPYVSNDPINKLDPSGLWGFGPVASISVEGGAIAAGAGATASVGVGIFGGGANGPNAGGFASGGTFAGGPGYGVSYPDPLPGGTTAAAGGYAGAGVGGFITNATSPGDLRGPFNTTSINLPIGSIQFGVSGQTWILSFTCGIPPCGVGAGTSGSTYPTNTSVAPGGPQTAGPQSSAEPPSPTGSDCPPNDDSPAPGAQVGPGSGSSSLLLQ